MSINLNTSQVHESISWLIDDKQFALNVLACMKEPYKRWDKLKKEIKQAGGGIHLYIEVMESFYRYAQAEFNAKVCRVSGQVRVCFQTPMGTYLEFAVRKGTYDQERSGFDVSTNLTAPVEQLALLEVESLPCNSVPMGKGLLLVHTVDPDNPGHCRVWLAVDWKGKTGEDFIKCENCIELGTVPFRAKRPKRRVQVGETPDLQAHNGK